MKKSKIVSLVGLFSLFASLSSCNKSKNNTTSPSISSPSTPTSPTIEERTTDENSFTYDVDEVTDNVTITGLKDPNYNHIVIPDYIDGKKVTKISSTALQNNLNIKSLYLNQFLSTAINGNYLFGSKNLEKLEISPDNPIFYVDGNCLIGKVNDPKSVHYLYFGFKNSVIPENITIKIEDYAFKGATFKSITIPKDVTSIINSAFSYCENLEDFVVKEGNTRYKAINHCLIEDNKYVMSGTKNSTIPTDSSINVLDNYTFNGIDIKEINIPKNITTFKGWNSDSQCFKDSGVEVVTFEEGTSILSPYTSNSTTKNYYFNYAFIGAKKLKTVHIPKGIPLSDEHNFFTDCEFLETVIFDEDVNSPEFRAFQNCSKLTNIEFSAEKNPYWKFENKQLKYSTTNSNYLLYGYFGDEGEINLDGVSNVVRYAFYKNKKIKSIKSTTSLNTIGQHVFEESSLESIDFDGSISKIDDYTFKNCKNLKEIKLPNTVTAPLGSYSFDGANIKKFFMPKSLSSMYLSAFNNAEVEQIEIEQGNPTHKSVDGHSILSADGKRIYTGFTDEEGNITIPYGVTQIDRYAFFGKNAKTITIPNTVTSISSDTFYNTKNLSNIVIPDSVTSIGDNAFQNSGIKSVKLPSKLTSIRGYAFSGTSNLKSVELPDTVTSIGTNAFQNSGIESIKLPSNITTINSSAFSGTSNLKSIELPDTVTSIGSYAFQSSGIESIKLPSNSTYTTLSQYIFQNAKRLKAITIPNTITSIDSGAFYGSGLEDVVFSNSLTTINSYAFYATKNLKTIEIPNSVTNIGDNAFQYSNINSIKLPKNNSFKILRNHVFESTTNLKTIEIPDSVTNIYTSAFANSGLESVKIPANVIKIDGGSVFANSNVKLVEIDNPTITISNGSSVNASFYNSINLKEIKFNGTLNQFKHVFTNLNLFKKDTGYTLEKVTYKDTDGTLKTITVDELVSSWSNN